MNEGNKDGDDGEDGEEVGETAAAKETEETSKKRRGNPKTHRGKEKYTQRRETTTERSEWMHKNVSETKIDWKDNKTSKEFSKTSKNSTKIFDDNEEDEYEREIRENGNESSTDVQINDTDEMKRIPEVATEELQDAINKLKGKSLDSDGIRAEDIKTCDDETREMVR